jgi:hypothetical protein
MQVFFATFAVKRLILRRVQVKVLTAEFAKGTAKVAKSV